MKHFIVIALLIAALIMFNSAHAKGVWEHWGAAPYATSIKEACEKAPAAIDGFNMPSPVKEHFKQILGDCSHGNEDYLVPRQELQQMWSGGKHPHLMNGYPVGALPVSKSPDGREYRAGAVFETAKAYAWTWTYEGKTYVLYLPLECFNWSWTFGEPQPIGEVVKEVPKGDCMRYNVDGRNYPLVMHPLQLVVSFYNHSDGDLHRLMADQCFYAEDGQTHQRLRLDRECKVCEGEQQAIWPADVVVGTKTEYIFSVYSADGKTLGFPSSYGAVYVPRWFVTSSLWCFPAAQAYWGNAPTWYVGPRRWLYMGYYDLVTQSEIQEDLTKGRKEFHRVIKPDGVLGK